MTNHWLRKLGGSETFTYTVITELNRLGHKVEYLTFQDGYITEKLNNLGIRPAGRRQYDLILASHNTTLSRLLQDKTEGPIVQTCHGVYPKLEQPSDQADYHVAISREVAEHIANRGYKSEIILNSIDTLRFDCRRKPGNKVKKVLSLSHDTELNNTLEAMLKCTGIEFYSLNKYRNPVWTVEKHINDVDLVITLGRGAYESMACGRPVLVLDRRPYVGKILGDGLITPDNIDQAIRNNCSGRRYMRTDIREMINEALVCNPLSLGARMREIALELFDVKKNIQKYLYYAGN